MTLTQIYYKASESGLVRSPDRNALQRARRAFKRNQEEPGDCNGDIALLAGLAIAQAEVGVRPGWIPEVQRIGCEIAKMIEKGQA